MTLEERVTALEAELREISAALVAASGAAAELERRRAKDAERKRRVRGQNASADKQDQEKNEEAEKRDIPPTPPIESKGEEVRKEALSNACARAGKFVPPTEEEVAAYCKAKGYAVDPVMFVSFYASKGWMIGKNKMKDWRRAVVTWTKRDEKEQNEKKKGVTYAANRRNVTAHQNCMLTDADREAIPY